MPVSAPASSPTSPKPPRLRLDYLDGLRGLAALYVVMHHAYYGWTAEASLPPLAAKWTYWLYLGHSAVDIFIVLSGYCLMLPVVRSGRLSGGTGEFIRRRARRILPPYFAALALSLLAIALLPPLRDLSHPQAFWNVALPAWTPGVIVSHLLLVHNFNPDWHSKIDYPMWSVATEWQIYFLFPLVLLPIWKRFGAAAAVAGGFVIGLVPLFLFYDRFSGVSPQFVGLFALGMAAADLNFSAKPSQAQWRDTVPWGGLSAGLLAVLVFVSVKHSSWPEAVAMKDIVVGAATMCLLIACTRSLTRGQGSWALRLMESRPAVWLGTFSYSLYLVHAPVLALCQSALRPEHLAPTTGLCVMLAAGVPLAMLASYLFHLAFEKPFLSRALVQAEKKLA